MLKVLLLITILVSVGGQSLLAADEEEAVVKSSAYISLGDAMVLNLSNESRRLTFLQLKADVLIADSDAEDLIKTHIPAIRHKLIVLLSEQKANEMKSSAKREEIRKIATAQIQELMVELANSSEVTDVLFSSFLVQ
ncbi:MAG: hypothetical protein GY806_10045 [Gammaproteobacteria bacterium]|nr:hypothetical protein [Gammaproteobacteria bacterium]